MNIVQPVRFDLTGDPYKMVLGSTWLQPFIYFASPDPGHYVGQVLEITADDPLYSVQLATGRIISDVPRDGSASWNPGDWVIVTRLYGAWKIVDPGAASLEDLSDVVRARAEVRNPSNEKLILAFDSSDEEDMTKPHIEFSTDSKSSIKLYAPAQSSIVPGVYEYDLFFYYSLVDPYDPVMRQYGKFEVANSLTKRS